MSYTPGPWVIRGKSSMEEHTQVILPTNPTLRDGGKIAYVFDDPSVDMGDAILIASAPDLLAVCQLIQRLHDQGAIETVYQTEPWRPLLDAAIAKAEGR